MGTILEQILSSLNTKIGFAGSIITLYDHFKIKMTPMLRKRLPLFAINQKRRMIHIVNIVNIGKMR